MSRKARNSREVRKSVRRRTRRSAPLPEWLSQAAGCAPRALVCADRAVIEGALAVADLSARAVALETRRGRVWIEGEELAIDRMDGGCVVVRGRVAAVRLEEADARA